MNRVIVVDDSPIDRRVAGHLLASLGDFEVEYAGNGIEALECVEEQIPLVVVTDLQMPEMDGLQLVETLHRRFPMVPVVLMTAHGSEDTALRALLLGAADFVPKLRLAKELPAVVRSVLAAAPSTRSNERVARYVRSIDIRYELDNDLRTVAPLIDQVQCMACDLELIADAERVRLAKAMEESLRNAILHGNLEMTSDALSTLRENGVECEPYRLRRLQRPYSDRKVRVRVRLTPEEARIDIRDEGRGFDAARVRNVLSEPRGLVEGNGRGMILMHAFMDEVSFSGAGNEVTLVKRRRSTAPLPDRR